MPLQPEVPSAYGKSVFRPSAMQYIRIRLRGNRLNAMSAKVLVLNGPNLNMLGVREPTLYGRATLADVEAACKARGAALGVEVDFRQSNNEGVLVDWILAARGIYAALVVNAAAYTHTSVAILDALLAVELPVVEVHISNIMKREAFRRHSYVAEAADGMITGFGTYGYELAVDAAAHLLKTPAKS